MKIAFTSLFAAIALIALNSCASSVEPMGMIYTDVATPVMANDNVRASKTGKSVSSSFLGIIATGDSSIEAAKKSAGITNVATVDRQRSHVLGIFGTYTTVVTGN